jgi:hypothetical protein
MKKYLAILSIMFFIGTTIYGRLEINNSNSGSDTIFVKLNDIMPALKTFEGNPEIDGIFKSVIYDQIGKDSYDDLFFQAAKMNATIKQLNFFISQSKKNPAFFADGAGLQFKKEATSLLTPTFIKDFTKQSNDLSERLTGFNPKNDFTGFKMSKIPSAITGIKNATNNLAEAVKGLGVLSTALAGTK